MSDQRKERSRSIFQIAMRSLLAVLAAEMLLLVGSLAMSGVIQTINRNAKDILAKQVENRGSYLAGNMTQSWSNLDALTSKVNALVAQRLADGKLKTEDFNRPGGSAQLVKY